jgi:hypothetical protein
MSSFNRWGQRVYDSSLGRFLEVDPIGGGSANDYDYAYKDPINGNDLTGQQGSGYWSRWCQGHWRSCRTSGGWHAARWWKKHT